MKKLNNNKYSKFNTKFLIWHLVEMTWSGHKKTKKFLPLSMDPTIPTIFKWLYLVSSSWVISPESLRDCISSGHSFLNLLAPVSEPSPPMTTKFVMPRLMRFLAAFKGQKEVLVSSNFPKSPQICSRISALASKMSQTKIKINKDILSC